MINATSPSIPSQDVEIDSAGNKFDPRWYRFVNDVEMFLTTFRNAPQQVLQADLARFASKLIAKKMQSGVQIWEPVFNHLLRWDGKRWNFAPGDGGSGYTQVFLSAPTAVGWVQCAGTANVPFLKGDGTLGTQTLPNTAGLYFRV